MNTRRVIICMCILSFVLLSFFSPDFSSAEPFGGCSATLSSDLLLHVPVILFDGQTYWADFRYVPGTFNFELISAGIAPEATGFEITATVTGRYLNQDTASVDVDYQPACDGDPTTNDPEPFTTHGAIFNISARLVDPKSTNVRPITIESYTVEYRRANDSTGAPPIQTATYFDTISIPVPTGANTSTLQVSGILVDLVRKGRYLDDIQSGQYTSGASLINNYSAVFRFSGQNNLGQRFTFQASTNFEIGSFDYCP